MTLLGLRPTLAALLLAGTAVAQDPKRYPPPELGSEYVEPVTAFPPLRDLSGPLMDVLVLGGAIALATWLVHRYRRRTALLVLAIIGATGDPSLDMVSTVSAVASSIGNVGPGLGLVGPTENYLVVPALGKWLLGGLMIVGRLEILPILILFNKELWRR